MKIKVLVADHPAVAEAVLEFFSEVSKRSLLKFELIQVDPGTQIPPVHFAILDPDWVCLGSKEGARRLMETIRDMEIPVLLTSFVPVNISERPGFRILMKPEFDLHKLELAIIEFLELIPTQQLLSTS